jgi:hypothetical protein
MADAEKDDKEHDGRGKVAHVTLGVNDAPPQEKTVPAGETLVSRLKTELGVDLALVLYLVHGQKRKLLDNSETIEVESGMHFEAIGGGGVS